MDYNRKIHNLYCELTLLVFIELIHFGNNNLSMQKCIIQDSISAEQGAIQLIRVRVTIATKELYTGACIPKYRLSVAKWAPFQITNVLGAAIVSVQQMPQNIAV